MAAIVGGFNQVRGAIAGGLLVGVIDNLAAAYVSTAYRQAVPLCLLVLIILFRPQGCSAAKRSARYEPGQVAARARRARRLALVLAPVDLTGSASPTPGSSATAPTSSRSGW